MDNESKLNAKLRLYAELEQEQAQNLTNAKHYLNINAYDFALPCVQRLVQIDEEIMETSGDIKAMREAIEHEAKDLL